MGKLVVTEFVSLDGVMQAPGGEDFKYPGWTFEFDRGDDGNEFKLQETMESDVLLIGYLCVLARGGRRRAGTPEAVGRSRHRPHWRRARSR
jgi:hypothetical protein